MPTGATTVSTGCGLTGDGSASAPVRARTGTWGFPCDLDANAGRVFCDSTGVLRSEPRGRTFFQQQSTTDNNPNTPVPAVYPTQIADHSLTFTNPDNCRDMFVICETELDIDFDLPPGSGAAWGIVGDEQGRLSNTGSSTQFDVRAQLPTCADAASRPSSRRSETRLPTGRRKAPGAAGPSAMTPTCTRSGTPSSA